MRSVAVVPSEVERQFLLESDEAVGNQDQSSRALGFERSHAALDYRQASMLVERPESELYPPTPTPPPECLRSELLAPVGNEMARPRTRFAENSIEEVPNCRRRWLRAIDGESHQTPGEMIDDGGNPPAEWPDLRQCAGEPGNPETECGRHGRQIDVPQVIGVSGGDRARGLLGSTARAGQFLVAEHPTHRRWAEVKACASEDLSDFHLSERRAKGFQAPHDVTDELGKAIDRFGQLDECVGAFLVEPGHPGGDGERAHLEDPR
jgi:hypothetical protein